MKRGQGRGVEGLHAKFPVNVFIVSASGGQKPQFFGKIWTFWGFCTDPVLPMTSKFGVL